MSAIITIPNPILRKKSKAVKKTDDKILTLIKTLKKTLNENEALKGVGLSAVQIGQPVRIFIARGDTRSDPQVFINPKITWKSKALTNGVPPSEDVKKENKKNSQLSGRPEGCLSVPGYFGTVRRHKSIKLKYSTLENNQLSTINNQLFSNFLATVIQHELDHLNGTLFIDRVLEQGGKLYKEEENQLVETTL